MPRLTKLTNWQRDMLPVWREKWTNIGLSCEPLNLEAAKRAIVKVYQSASLLPPKHFVVCDSPVSGAVTATVLQNLTASVGDSVRASVGDSVRASVRDSVWASVWDSVWEQSYGAHDASWLSFYDFLRDVCKVRECDPLLGLIELAQHCGWWAPYRQSAILQHRHCKLHRDDSGRLHNSHGLAVAYRDGWGVYALHGVRVPQWLVETPAGRLDAKKIISEPNVEVRREGVRKIGVERLVYELGAETRCREGDYELLSIDLGLREPAIALKMLNPSVPELWHIEFVPPECETVEHALNFRNGLGLETIDDDTGADWYQQGDVILRPKGAIKFKSRPKLLT